MASHAVMQTCQWPAVMGASPRLPEFQVIIFTSLCTQNCNCQCACLKGELLLQSGSCMLFCLVAGFVGWPTMGWLFNQEAGESRQVYGTLYMCHDPMQNGHSDSIPDFTDSFWVPGSLPFHQPGHGPASCHSISLILFLLPL